MPIHQGLFSQEFREAFLERRGCEHCRKSQSTQCFTSYNPLPLNVASLIRTSLLFLYDKQGFPPQKERYAHWKGFIGSSSLGRKRQAPTMINNGSLIRESEKGTITALNLSHESSDRHANPVWLASASFGTLNRHYWG